MASLEQEHGQNSIEPTDVCFGCQVDRLVTYSGKFVFFLNISFEVARWRSGLRSWSPNSVVAGSSRTQGVQTICVNIILALIWLLCDCVSDTKPVYMFMRYIRIKVVVVVVY